MAHSMGGLVAQRCICDNKSLRDRITHLFLYGTPSKGLHKATYVGRLKRQIRDMGTGSKFIEELRADWLTIVGGNTPFAVRAIAGDCDEL